MVVSSHITLLSFAFLVFAHNYIRWRCFEGGGYAQYCTIPEKMAMKIPDGYSFEEAAAIPEVKTHAHASFVWISRSCM